jgi:hypothetical protein
VIRYALRCEKGHGFEAWFRGFDDFERQREGGLIACPACGNARVEKALMAPSVATSRAREARAEAVGAPASEPAAADAPAVAVAATSSHQAELIARLRELKAQLTASADNVGRAFPEEARKIHYGDAEARGIYGEASGEEVRELVDEGIAVMPLPVLPEERN